MNAIICTSHKLIRTEIFYYFMKSIRRKKLGEKQVVLKINSRRNILCFQSLEWQLTEHQPTNQRQARMCNEIFTQILLSLFFSPNTKCSQVCPGKFGVRVFGSNRDSGPWPVLLTNSHLNTWAHSDRLMRRLIAADTTTCWPAHLQRHVLISLNETGRLRPQPSLGNVTSLCL